MLETTIVMDLFIYIAIKVENKYKFTSFPTQVL